MPGRPCESGLEGREGKRQWPTTPTATVWAGTETVKPGAGGHPSSGARLGISRVEQLSKSAGTTPRLRDPGDPAHRGRGSGPVTSSLVIRIRVALGPIETRRSCRMVRLVGSELGTPRGRLNFRVLGAGC